MRYSKFDTFLMQQPCKWFYSVTFDTFDVNVATLMWHVLPIGDSKCVGETGASKVQTKRLCPLFLEKEINESDLVLISYFADEDVHHTKPYVIGVINLFTPKWPAEADCQYIRLKSIPPLTVTRQVTLKVLFERLIKACDWHMFLCIDSCTDGPEFWTMQLFICWVCI